jgi:hypothetical protein
MMVGLPGSTVETVKSDYQKNIDREVMVRSHPTLLLANSPMNAPEYRDEHGIEGVVDQVITTTATYTLDEWRHMMALRLLHYHFDHRGVLRQVATYVRAETGLEEMDFYEAVRVAAQDFVRWPHLAYAVTAASIHFTPPGSWAPVIEEIGEFLVHDLRVADDDALATVLRIQHAVLPSRTRSFPLQLDLPHDYAAWHASVVRAKLEDPDRWTETVAALRSFGPGPFAVDDPATLSEALTGTSAVTTQYERGAPDLESAIARPRRPPGRGEVPVEMIELPTTTDRHGAPVSLQA